MPRPMSATVLSLLLCFLFPGLAGAACPTIPVCEPQSTCPTAPMAVANGGSFAVPCGCNYMRIYAWAGGGSSGWGGPTYYLAEGGGGAAFVGIRPVVPGMAFQVKFPNVEYGAGRGLALARLEGPSCDTKTLELALGSGGRGGKFAMSTYYVEDVGNPPSGGAGGLTGQDGFQAKRTKIADGTVETASGGKGALPTRFGDGGSVAGYPGSANSMEPDNLTALGGSGACGNGGNGATGYYGAGGGGGVPITPPSCGGAAAFAGGGGGSSWSSIPGAVYPGNRKSPGLELHGYRVGLTPGNGDVCPAEGPGTAGCGGAAMVTGCPGGCDFRGGPGRLVAEFSAAPFPTAAGKGDVNGDGMTDLTIRNGVAPGLGTWEHRFWLMNGVNRLSEATLYPAPDAALDLSGQDDFNGDGKQDLVMRNTSTNEVTFWLMNGTDRISEVSIPGLPAAWKLSATGYVDQDGSPDLLWRDYTTQKLVVWTMSGTTQVSSIIPKPDQAANVNWEIVGAPDMNGDGQTDLLWYNWDSGKIVYWTMKYSADFTECTGQGFPAAPCYYRITGAFTNPDSAGNNNWKVLAVGDYGSASGNDLVWRNATSGKFVIWYMDFAGNRTSGTFTSPEMPAGTATDWTIVGPR